MTTIRSILTDANNGLLPFLDAKLQGTYERLNVQPWSFDGASDQRSGFRLRDFRSEYLADHHQLSRTVLLGRIFPMATNIDATLEAADFIEEITRLLHGAHQCVAHTQPIETISGSSFAQQSKSSQKWWMIVVIQFELQYYER